VEGKKTASWGFGKKRVRGALPKSERRSCRKLWVIERERKITKTKWKGEGEAQSRGKGTPFVQRVEGLGLWGKTLFVWLPRPFPKKGGRATAPRQRGEVSMKGGVYRKKGLVNPEEKGVIFPAGGEGKIT